MVLQFGLSEEYDRLQISRLIPLLRYWPEENLAIQVTVESLIRPRFQRWLRDTLMQCEKSQRKRIIIELAEADVGQHISRLQPVIRLVNALGVRVAVNQAGLTLVSTSWIKELNVELLKLHPGWSETLRSERRTCCWFKAWWKPAPGPAPKFTPPVCVREASGRP
ncbi:putative signal transduction protein [Escherichia coli]|uniref:Putative signal transduction protein n=1 Tax=Escherichia coli TaxID=562 RepID=A0A2X3LMQ8_ECOLX|nr:putative signal transduction protein [Escherichia coli]